MKFLTPVSCCVLAIFSVSVQAGEVAQIEVSNALEGACVDEPVALGLSRLGLKGACESHLSLKSEDGSVVQSQLIDSNGDGFKDMLFFINSLKDGEVRKLTLHDGKQEKKGELEKRTQVDLAIKEGGKWVKGKAAGDKSRGDWQYEGGTFVNVDSLEVPGKHSDHSNYIRYEGVGIESEKVGYRIYLDWRNGFDIFGKTKEQIVLSQVGLDGFESYHHMADWGMDVLKVGDTLGMGGYGFWDGNKVVRVSDTDALSCNLIENGDIYSSLSIQYDGWNYDGENKIDLQALLSMQAGKHTVDVTLTSSELVEGICTGLVKHDGTEFIEGNTDITGEAWSYIATWGKQSLDGKNLGMAVLFQRKSLRKLTEDEGNYVVVLRNYEPVYNYKFLAVYEGEVDGIDTKDEFVNYLEQTVDRLTIPLRIRTQTIHAKSQKTIPATSASAKELAIQLVESQLTLHGLHQANGQFDVDNRRKARWGYTTGLLNQSFDDLYRLTGDEKYRKHAFEVIGSFVSDDGTIDGYKIEDYNIDQINSGKMLLRLYNETKDEKFRKAADWLRLQLKDHPRTSEGGFWHKQRYPYQLWLDGVYMGMPFLAEWELLFNNGDNIDEAIHEFELIRKYCRNPETGLYYHAWDEKKLQVWADKETGLSKHYWARGFGWYMMALVDTLDLLPEDDAKNRGILVSILEEACLALINYQDPDSGCWYQILDQPERVGNYLESSGSSMFVYAMAKGLNQGYLDSALIREAAKRAFDGMVKEFIEIDAKNHAHVTHICRVAGLGFGRDGSYKYYMSEPVVKNDPKGLGPFIMASIEMSKLLSETQE